LVELDINNNCRLIFIGENFEPSLISKIQKNDIIITYQLNFEEELRRQKKIQVINFHRYVQSKEIWDTLVLEARTWLEDLPKKVVHKGESLLENFKFEDTSLWWFVYDSIWETKNGLFDTFYNLKGITYLIEKYSPSNIEISGSFDYPIKDILTALEKKYKFSLKITKYNVKIKPKSEFESTSSRLLFLWRLIFLKFAKKLSSSKQKQIAIILKHGTAAIHKNRNGIQIITDHYLDGLDDYMLQKSNNIHFISLNMPLLKKSLSKNLLKEFFQTIQGIYVPWISYHSFSDLHEMNNLVKHYQNFIFELENDLDFKKSMFLDDIDLYPFLKEIFRKNIPRIFAFVQIQIKLARRFLKEENPKVVLSTDSISPQGRALCLACNSQKIRVITLQGGIISPELPINTGFLIHEKFDTRLLPNYLVWGPFYEELIKSRGYPPSFIKNVGFWQSKSITSNLINIENYVLYIAGANLKKLSYVLSLEEEIFTIKKIHEVISKNFKLVVKLHPSLSHGLYSKKLGNLKNLLLLDDTMSYDKNELITNAKAVVGKGSTVLIQAAIMKKPVIIVNFTSNLNFIGIDKLPFVTSPQELKKIFDEILEEKFTADYDLSNFCNPVGTNSISAIIKEIERDD